MEIVVARNYYEDGARSSHARGINVTARRFICTGLSRRSPSVDWTARLISTERDYLPQRITTNCARRSGKSAKSRHLEGVIVMDEVTRRTLLADAGLSSPRWTFSLAGPKETCTGRAGPPMQG
jgi:hypothetical protein